MARLLISPIGVVVVAEMTRLRPMRPGPCPDDKYGQRHSDSANEMDDTKRLHQAESLILARIFSVYCL